MEPIRIDQTHYRINVPSHVINFNFFGCGGTGVLKNDPTTTPQYKVGAQIAKIKKAAFTCILGDMFYATSMFPNDGLAHPKDEKLIGSFQAPYKDIKNPIFCIAGNHLYGYHNSKRYTKGALKTFNGLLKIVPPAKNYADSFLDSMIQTGDTLAKNLFNNQYAELLKEKGLKGPSLHISSKGYYVISVYPKGSKEPAINIFMLNSNTMDKDKEQQAWLKEEVSKSKADKNFIFQHHPVATYNKLKFKVDDTNCYGYSEENIKHHRLKSVREYFSKTKYRNYNDLNALVLIDILGEDLKKIDYIGAAHAHQEALSTLNTHPLFAKLRLNKNLIQFIVGSGGGALQHFTWFGHKPHHFAKKFGFVNYKYNTTSKQSNIKYISDDGRLQAEYLLTPDNTPIENYNSKHDNIFWSTIKQAISESLDFIYKADPDAELSALFTQLLECIQQVANFTKENIPVLTKQNKINALIEHADKLSKDSVADQTHLKILKSQIKEAITPSIRNASKYFEYLICKTKREHLDNFEKEPYSKFKSYIIQYIQKNPKQLTKKRIKIALKSIISCIANRKDNLTLINQLRIWVNALDDLVDAGDPCSSNLKKLVESLRCLLEKQKTRFTPSALLSQLTITSSGSATKAKPKNKFKVDDLNRMLKGKLVTKPLDSFDSNEHEDESTSIALSFS